MRREKKLFASIPGCSPFGPSLRFVQKLLSCNFWSSHPSLDAHPSGCRCASFKNCYPAIFGLRIHPWTLTLRAVATLRSKIAILQFLVPLAIRGRSRFLPLITPIALLFCGNRWSFPTWHYIDFKIDLLRSLSLRLFFDI